jgi:hypothetical protein
MSNHTETIPEPALIQPQAIPGPYRFRAGVMRGLLVTSCPDGYLQSVVTNGRADSEAVRACREELQRRADERQLRQFEDKGR